MTIIRFLFRFFLAILFVFISSIDDISWGADFTVHLPDSLERAKNKVEKKIRQRAEEKLFLKVYHRNSRWHNTCEFMIPGNSGESGVWANHQLATGGWVPVGDETSLRTVVLRRGKHQFLSLYKLPNGRVLKKHDIFLVPLLTKEGTQLVLGSDPPIECREDNDIFYLPFGRRWK